MINKRKKISSLRDKLRERVGKKEELGLYSRLSFGQFKGYELVEVIKLDAQYVNWLVEEKKLITLDNDAYRFYIKEYEVVLSRIIFIDKDKPKEPYFPWEFEEY